MIDRLHACLSALLKKLRATSATRMCYDVINYINVQLSFKGRPFRVINCLKMRKSREANLDTTLMMRQQRTCIDTQS